MCIALRPVLRLPLLTAAAVLTHLLECLLPVNSVCPTWSAIDPASPAKLRFTGAPPTSQIPVGVFLRVGHPVVLDEVNHRARAECVAAGPVCSVIKCLPRLFNWIPEIVEIEEVGLMSEVDH